MIQYLQHHDIDRAKWDVCIEQSINSLIYASSWYLDAVSPGWEALVLDDYTAVMPLTKGRKYFLNYLYQPFFTQQLGVFSKLEIRQEVLQKFIEAIPKKFRFIEIQLNEKNHLLDERFKVKKTKNYLLNLNKSYDKIYKDYNEQAKRNLKKAKKQEIEIKTIPHGDIINFYKLHKGIVTKGVKEADYQRFSDLMEEAWQRKKLIARAVYNKTNELLAAGLFLSHRNRIIFILGTASESGRDAGAMHFLFDNLIFQFAEHKMVLDFEGSEIPGIARFFKSFGAEKFHYYRLKMNRLPWFIKLIKP